MGVKGRRVHGEKKVRNTIVTWAKKKWSGSALYFWLLGLTEQVRKKAISMQMEYIPYKALYKVYSLRAAHGGGRAAGARSSEQTQECIMQALRPMRNTNTKGERGRK